MNPLVFPLELQRQSLDAANKFLTNTGVAADQLETIANVDVGATPSEAVYRENKLELHHYEPITDEQQDIPILIVYALINRPYILDLQPDRSVIRRFLEAGFDVYLIDWDEPSLLDGSLGLEDYVLRYIDNCVEVVKHQSGVDSINLLGYCMGGTMAAMYAGVFPENVRNLGMMAAGLCFSGDGGVLELWGAEDYYSPSVVSETFGTVPAAFFDIGFAMMDPIQNTVTKYAYLYDNLDDDDFVENFARMEKWLSDGIGMAGRTYEQFLTDIYQENKLYNNELHLGETHVDITNIDMPVLQIVADYDHLVPPEASRPFNDVVPSDDTEIMSIQAGHIGLSVSSRSHAELWPEVAGWFETRSTEVDPHTLLQDIEGIGPTYADRLVEAGVTDMESLYSADPNELADEIGVSVGMIEEWQGTASRHSP